MAKNDSNKKNDNSKENNSKNGNSKKGFASMDKEKAQQARSKGGKSVSKDRAHMAEIGRLGGKHSHISTTK